MKKINLLFVALVAMMTVFTSCEDVDGLLDTSDVVIDVTSAIDAEYLVGEVYTVKFTVEATDSKIDEIVVRKNGADFYTVDDVEKYSNIVTFTDSSLVADSYSYLIIVTDKDDVQTTATVIITVKEATTPLADAVDLTWTRIGGADATGDLAMFGLDWTGNEGGKVIIKNEATKLVVLTEADWTNLTTVEALAEAVETATGVEQFDAISTDASGTYNEVIATVKDGVYYMINITKSNVSFDATIGTTITILGAYKK